MKAEPKAFSLQSLLSFEHMLTPLIIRGVYLVGVIFCVFGGLGAMSRGGHPIGFIGGLFGAILGIFFVRIVCETLIVVFQINEALSDIKALLQKQA